MPGHCLGSDDESEFVFVRKMVLFRSTLHTLTCELSSLGYVQVNNVDVDVNFAK